MRKNLFKNWDRHQKKWYGKWHLYLGIIAGLVVAIVGITGSLLVFRDEIDRALNPGMMRVLAHTPRLPVDQVYALFHQQHPDITVDYIYRPDDNPNASLVFYNYANEKQLFVNPFNGQICGSRLYESGFVNVVMNIHRTLLIPRIGEYVVGIASLILIILTISGLRLWIPRKWKQLKDVLTVKSGANWRRQNYDWHNVLGFYSAPVVVLLALTGFCITFYVPIVGITFSLSGKDPVKASQIYSMKSTYQKDKKSIGLADVLAIGNKTFPSAKWGGIALPGGDTTGVYRLDVVLPTRSRDGRREMVVVDRYSGKILATSKEFPQVAGGLLSWMQPLHYGTFGGLPTRILALIGGLVPAALFITGFIIWWPRWKKQRHKSSASRLKRPSSRPASLQYFLTSLKKGFSYALWTALLAAVCGALYGLAAGIIIQPAVYTIIFLVPIIGVNFLIAFSCLLIQWIVLLPIRKTYQPIYRYFALSLSFFLVFLPLYYLLMHTGLEIF